MKPSVFFVTFHKCASTLFALYVLKHIEGLTHVDYAGQRFFGTGQSRIEFKPTGCVYGPIRLSTDPASPAYQVLVKPLTETGFLYDKTVVFLVRDPRDILVSRYYSTRFSHVLSPVEEVRQAQLARRNAIQSKTLDEFALDTATKAAVYFDTAYRLSRACPRSVVLRYEDMIERWDVFARDLTRYMDIAPAVMSTIFAKSRPRETEDVLAHRRSGKVGGFRGKLKAETVASLNQTLALALQRFGYEV